MLWLVAACGSATAPPDPIWAFDVPVYSVAVADSESCLVAVGLSEPGWPPRLHETVFMEPRGSTFERVGTVRQKFVAFDSSSGWLVLTSEGGDSPVPALYRVGPDWAVGSPNTGFDNHMQEWSSARVKELRANDRGQVAVSVKERGWLISTDDGATWMLAAEPPASLPPRVPETNCRVESSESNWTIERRTPEGSWSPLVVLPKPSM